MTQAAKDGMAPTSRAGGSAETAAGALWGLAAMEQRLRDLEENHARLEDAITQRLDEMFFEIVGARLASTTTQSRTGTRDGEWAERRAR
jgi:hypothetical protein